MSRENETTDVALLLCSPAPASGVRHVRVSVTNICDFTVKRVLFLRPGAVAGLFPEAQLTPVITAHLAGIAVLAGVFLCASVIFRDIHQALDTFHPLKCHGNPFGKIHRSLEENLPENKQPHNGQPNRLRP